MVSKVVYNYIMEYKYNTATEKNRAAPLTCKDL